METLTDDTFQAAVAGDVPVLVEFAAVWCGPCRMIEPVLNEIATERAGALRVAKIDMDDSPRTARDLGVMAAPTLQLYRRGELIAQTVGAKPKMHLTAWLDQALESAPASR
jgi:thioredoxin 1